MDVPMPSLEMSHPDAPVPKLDPIGHSKHRITIKRALATRQDLPKGLADLLRKLLGHRGRRPPPRSSYVGLKEEEEDHLPLSPAERDEHYRRRTDRNTLALFHQLPVEVLRTIFTMVVQDTNFRNGELRFYFPKVQKLARVCKFWSAVIMGYSAIWAVVHVDSDATTDATARAALRRSENTLLSVQIYGERTEEAWALVEESVRRWETADVWIEGSSSALENAQAPGLKKLKISAHEGCDALIHLFKKGAPHLVDLSLRRVSLENWKAGSLDNLRVLDIRDLEFGGPLVKHFLEALGSIANLEELKMISITFDDSQPSEPIHPPIVFPRLTSLVMDEVVPQHADRILTGIRTPVLDNLTLGSNKWADRAELVPFDWKTGLEPLLDSRMRTGSAITFRFEDEFEMHVEILHATDVHDRPSFHLRLSSWDEMAEDIGETFHPSRTGLPACLSLEGKKSPRFLRRFLYHISGITELRLTNFHDAGDLIHFLARPQQTHPSRPEEDVWLFPELSRLSVDDCRRLYPELLLDFVQSRAAADCGEFDVVSPLIRLQVRGTTGMDDERWSQIVEVLGDDVVEWSPSHVP